MTTDYAIEEFKALRTELLYMIKMIKLYEGFFFTAVSASFGLLISEKNIPITILLIALAYIIMVYRYDYSKGVAKIGAYISIFIEPHIKNLEWENNLTILKEMEKNKTIPTSVIQEVNRKIKKYMFNFIIFFLSAYCLYRIGISFSLNTIAKIFPLTIINILTILNVIDMSRKNYSREHYLELWGEIKVKKLLIINKR